MDKTKSWLGAKLLEEYQYGFALDRYLDFLSRIKMADNSHPISFTNTGATDYTITLFDSGNTTLQQQIYEITGGIAPSPLTYAQPFGYSYDEMNQSLRTDPLLLDILTIPILTATDLSIYTKSINWIYKDSTGRQTQFPVIPVEYFNVNQSQSGWIDMTMNPVILLDGLHTMQFTIPAVSTIKFTFYFREMKLSSLLNKALRG